MPRISASFTLTEGQVAEAWGAPFDTTKGSCHSVSLAVVKARIIPGARVARGVCRGVPGQHSWITVGDPYDKDSPIFDPTLWGYDPDVDGVWHGTGHGPRPQPGNIRLRPGGRHTPHGAGTIWDYGRPVNAGGTVIELTPTTPLSTDALDWLDLLGPLDRPGWMRLANAPVGGWPAAELIAAMADTKQLAALVPIDVLGMLTDRNPGGLYLPIDE